MYFEQIKVEQEINSLYSAVTKEQRVALKALGIDLKNRMILSISRESKKSFALNAEVFFIVQAVKMKCRYLPVTCIQERCGKSTKEQQR